MNDPAPLPPDSGPPASSATPAHRSRIAKVTRRAHFQFRWIAYGIVLLVVAAMAARPVYRWTKGVRAGRMVSEMERLLHEDRVLDAGRPLRAASQLAPNDPRVIRANAEYFSRLLRPEALTHWQRLIAVGAATKSDRRHFAETALRMRRLDLAGEQLRVLTQGGSPDEDVCFLAVQHFRLRRDFQGAVEAAREAMQVARTNEDSQFLLGTVLVESPQPRHRGEGRARLVELAVAGGRHGGEAFDLLLLHPELPTAEGRKLLAAFSGKTNLTLPERLRVASLKVRLDPAHKSAVGDELMSVFAPASLEARLPAALWMGTRGLNEQVLRLLPPDQAVTNHAALAIRIEALVRLDRWDEVDPLLARTDLPLDQTFGAGFRAAQAVHQGNQPGGETHLRDALEAASNRVDRLQFVSRYSEHLGFPALAIEAQMRLLFAPGRTWQSAEEVLRLVEPMGDASMAKEVLDRLALLMPGDPGVTAEQAYHRLLFNEDVSGTRKRMAELRERVTGNPQIEVVSAFAEVKAGNAVEALNRLEGLQFDWNRQPVRWQVVYVAALGAGERREAAREFARRIDLRRLRTPERELVRPWL